MSFAQTFGIETMKREIFNLIWEEMNDNGFNLNKFPYYNISYEIVDKYLIPITTLRFNILTTTKYNCYQY